MSRYEGLTIYQADFGQFFAVPTFPNAEVVFESIDTIDHLWKSGERLDKLAYLYYKNESLWWVISWFNNIPDESELEPGRPIFIPQNPEIVISLFQKTNRTIGK